jgi:hypothetical protein
LCLSELITTILAHLVPTGNYFNNSVDDSNDDHNLYESQDYNADATGDERAAAREVLRAAVLVNCAWYAAGVPLL